MVLKPRLDEAPSKGKHLTATHTATYTATHNGIRTATYALQQLEPDRVAATKLQHNQAQIHTEHHTATLQRLFLKRTATHAATIGDIPRCSN